MDNINRNGGRQEYRTSDNASPSGRRKTKKKGIFSNVAGALTYVLFVLGVSLVLTTVIVLLANDMLAFVKPDAEVTVTIPEDASLKDVSHVLSDSKVIKYSSLFTLFEKIKKLEDGYVPAGQYEMNTKYDYQRIIQVLRKDENTRSTVRITFPEGYTTEQIVDLLVEKEVCDRESLMDVIESYDFDYDFMDQTGEGERRLEGFLYPDTYEFYVDDNAVRVITRFLDNFNTKYSDSMRELTDEGKYSMREILTIASLVEREAKLSDEQGIVAGVIVNRLKSSSFPYLQIDATVQYAIGHKEKLTDEDLLVDDPYNTYKYKGLPPGPIANPGFTAITAALNPGNHKYYYYVARPNGSHIFSKTKAEHDAAVAKAKKEFEAAEAAE